MKKENKVGFVIPAYNEEKNIGKVIDSIRKEFIEADIIVTNDVSTDNTLKIIKEKGVICLTPPFNMRYAMAVQTGIKYAYENNYDYVIQFDADGQHLAKEAKKMYEYIIKNDCDIVIGSRFLKKTDYHHPLFRKIGTFLFQKTIKILCHKNITDPTSGLQCFNKKVIKKYAAIGQYPEYPDANLIIEMLYEGYKIEEIPVIMKESNTGKSMHSGIIKPIKYMVRIFYTITILFIRNIFRRGADHE
ncbi:MAG: glycosyltransferase family 2 protein [Bacilli bacterium]